MKKKILFAYYSMIIGGSTTSLLSLINAIDRSKYDVYLILYRNNGELFNYIPENVTLLEPAASKKNLVNDIKKILLAIFKGYLFKGLSYQIKNKKNKFPSTLFSEIQAKYFSRKINQKFDIAIGGMEGWSDKYIAYRIDADIKMCWLHSLYSKITDTPSLEIDWIEKIDYIVTISEACKIDFCKLHPDFSYKTVVIKNILDKELVLKRACEDTDDKYIEKIKSFSGLKIITVARFDPVKALHRVVLSAKELKNNNIDFLWTIIGDGIEKEKLLTLVEKNNLSDKVIFLGMKKNPYPFIKYSDLFCLTSYYEGTPVTVVESQMLGVIPIVTEYPSAFDQIKNGKTGFVVQNTDMAVAEKIQAIYEKNNLIKEIKINLNKYDFSKNMELNDFYKYIEKIKS